MINTLFLTTLAVEPSFVAFHLHSPTYVRGLSYHSFKFLWTTGQTKPPTILFGIVACTFSDSLSRNSCIQHPRIVNRLDLPPNLVKRRTPAQWTHATTTSSTLALSKVKRRWAAHYASGERKPFHFLHIQPAQYGHPVGTNSVFGPFSVPY